MLEDKYKKRKKKLKKDLTSLVLKAKGSKYEKNPVKAISSSYEKGKGTHIATLALSKAKDRVRKSK